MKTPRVKKASKGSGLVRLNHQLNYVRGEAHQFEHPVLQSETVPDQTLSITELMHKHSLGQPVRAVIREPIWNGDIFVPNYEALDLAERQELAEEYQQEAEQHREDQKQQIAKKEATRKVEAEKLAERERLLSQFEKSQQKAD